MGKILEEQKKFYKNLYTSKITHNQECRNNQTPTLREADKIHCKTPITLEECSNYLQIINLRGLMGLPPIFIKFSGRILKTLYLKALNIASKQSLSVYQRMGILNLLPKKDQ